MYGLFAYIGNTRGNVAVATALSIIALTGVGGLAVLVSQGNSARSELQSGLDAAVLAATAMPSTATSKQRLETARNVFAANAEVWKKNGTMHFAVAPQQAAQFTVTKTQVQGAATAFVSNPIGAALGIRELKVASESRAEKAESEPLCVLALNDTNKESIYAYGSAAIRVGNCAIQANSRSGSGIQLDGQKSEISASRIGVTGGFGGTGSGWSPMPVTGTVPVDDPYADLPVPASGTCIDIGNKLTQAVVTLQPGTYCGGLEIKAGSTVTLSSGIYIMKDGQFSVNSGATVQGEEVMIAFVGANSYMYLQSGSTTRLTSPLDGTYRNIQFMSDRDLSKSKFGEEWTTILGGATLEYDGVMYLPEQQVWVSGTASQTIVRGRSPSHIMITDSIWAQGNAVFDFQQANLRNLQGFAPASGFLYGARLIR